MAQILKFQEGGTLTIDGVKYDINDHLISQYRFLGNELTIQIKKNIIINLCLP